MKSHFSVPLKAALLLLMAIVLSGCLTAKRPPSDNQILVDVFQQEGLEARETPRGVVVYLPAAMFMFGSAELSPAAADKVGFIARVSNQKLAMNRNIAIEGHTDSIGSEASNMELSEARTSSVASMLIDNQLGESRIKTAWFGEGKPLVPNTHPDGSDNPEGRAANRRVEFILLNQ